MTATIQIKRTLTPGNAPVNNSLAAGELAVEMASTPPRLWCGVPTTIDASGQVEITLPVPIDIAYGGTGGTTAAQARSNLGIGQVGTQPAPLGTVYGGTGWATAPANAVLLAPAAVGAPLQTVLPLTVASGGTGLIAGTSGGIPFFSAAGAMASSAALDAGAYLLGGGVGVAPHSSAWLSEVATPPSLLFNSNAAMPPLPSGGTNIILVGNEIGNNTRVNLHANAATAGNLVQGFSYRGTLAARTPTLANDLLFELAGYGFPQGGAWIDFVAVEDFSATTGTGTAINIYTIAPGTTTAARRMQIGEGVMIGTTADPGAGNLAVQGTISSAHLSETANSLVYSTNADRPAGPFNGTNFQIAGNDIGSGSTRINMDANSAFANNIINAGVYRGTRAARTPTQAGDGLFELGGYGHPPGGGGAFIDLAAAETWSATANGTRIRLSTTSPGTVTITERLRIGEGVIIGNPSSAMADPGAGNLAVGGSVTITPRPNVQYQFDPYGGLLMGSRANVYNAAPYFQMSRGRPDLNLPRQSDYLASIALLGQNAAGGSLGSGVGIVGVAAEDWTTTSQASHLVFLATKPGTINQQWTARLDGFANLVLGESRTFAVADDQGGTLSAAGVYLGRPGLAYAAIAGRGAGGGINIADLGFNAGLWIVLTGVAATSSAWIDGNWTFGNNVTVMGVFTNPSDRRLKTGIAPFQRGLDEVLQLQPVAYHYDPEMMPTAETERTLYGLIADDVEAIMPELVRLQHISRAEQDYGEFKMLDVGSLTYVLINAVKTLAGRVATLEAAGAAPRPLMPRA